MPQNNIIVHYVVKSWVPYLHRLVEVETQENVAVNNPWETLLPGRGAAKAYDANRFQMPIMIGRVRRLRDFAALYIYLQMISSEIIQNFKEYKSYEKLYNQERFLDSIRTVDKDKREDVNIDIDKLKGNFVHRVAAIRKQMQTLMGKIQNDFQNPRYEKFTKVVNSQFQEKFLKLMKNVKAKMELIEKMHQTPVDIYQLMRMREEMENEAYWLTNFLSKSRKKLMDVANWADKQQEEQAYNKMLEALKKEYKDNKRDDKFIKDLQNMNTRREVDEMKKSSNVDPNLSILNDVVVSNFKKNRADPKLKKTYLPLKLDSEAQNAEEVMAGDDKFRKAMEKRTQIYNDLQSVMDASAVPRVGGSRSLSERVLSAEDVKRVSGEQDRMLLIDKRKLADFEKNLKDEIRRLEAERDKLLQKPEIKADVEKKKQIYKKYKELIKLTKKLYVEGQFYHPEHFDEHTMSSRNAKYEESKQRLNITDSAPTGADPKSKGQQVENMFYNVNVKPFYTKVKAYWKNRPLKFWKFAKEEFSSKVQHVPLVTINESIKNNATKRRFFKNFVILNHPKAEFCFANQRRLAEFKIHEFRQALPRMMRQLLSMQNIKQTVYCAACDARAQAAFRHDKQLLVFDQEFCRETITKFADYIKWKNIYMVEYLDMVYQATQCLTTSGREWDFPFAGFLDYQKRRIPFIKECYNHIGSPTFL